MADHGCFAVFGDFVKMSGQQMHDVKEYFAGLKYQVSAVAAARDRCCAEGRW